MTRCLDIQIGVGIGPVRFGMTMDEVMAVMDEPELYEDWMGGNLNDALLYHGLIFGFFGGIQAAASTRDRWLTEITVRGREDARLLGRPIEDWTRVELVRALRSDGLQVDQLTNGDVNVRGFRSLLELSFDREDVLMMVGLEGIGH